LNDHPPIEEIWVNVAEGAEKTGYHPDHVRRLARENGRLPEDQRFIRIRKDSHGYAIWLPDLMNYLERGASPPAPALDHQVGEETWVNTAEAAEITGYNRYYLMKLARTISQQPEGERLIRIRRRYGYEMWLPDLTAYVKNVRIGRPPKGIPKT
jgi:hypothetical protein